MHCVDSAFLQAKYFPMQFIFYDLSETSELISYTVLA